MNLTTQLQERFLANSHRHTDVQWEQVVPLLTEQVLARIEAMENTGGEPDVMLYDHALYYVDFAPESPVERRNLCYDSKAFASRKKSKVQPEGDVLSACEEMGVSLIGESMYLSMQSLDNLDLKTSTWLATPYELRAQGGALFGDKRYGRAFIYHNGAQSFYSSRGYRTYYYLGAPSDF